jgi:hypothetical protein
LWHNNGRCLDKTQLANELALDIADEINNKSTRQITKLEEEINKIITIITKPNK